MNYSVRRPPILAEAILSGLIGSDPEGRSILGDLREEYSKQLEANGVAAAKRWYWREALSVVAFRFRDRFPNDGQSARPKSYGIQKGDSMVRRIISELRFGMRTLWRTPAYTIVAAITLALGIGANSAIFSVVDSVLLNPLPYPDSDRIVGVWHQAPALGYDQFGSSPGIYYQYLEQNDVFESMALFRPDRRNLTGTGDPEILRGARTSSSLFQVLKVPPMLGRPFHVEEDLPGVPLVVILSNSLWKRRFGSDPGIIGRSVLLNGNTHEVVGIMPPGFSFPEDETDYWVPLAIDPGAAPPGEFGWRAIARVKPDVEVERAAAQVSQLCLRLRETWADQAQLLNFLEAGNLGSLVHTLKDDMVSDLQGSLWILLGTVGFVLLIACANVANLTLVRADTRGRENAVRTALGADRWTLLRQSLSESFILAALGGILGLGIAYAGVGVLTALAPNSLPRLNELGVDTTVLVFTVLITALSAILFGAAPGLKRVPIEVLSTLIQSGSRSSAGRDRQYVRSALVVAQTALALILLIGSGLMVRSFWEIKNVNPGFDPDNVLVFRVSLPATTYVEPVDVANLHQQLLDRISGLPGVVGVGAVENVPLVGGARGTGFVVEDQPITEGDMPPIFWFTTAAPGYFETMRIPLIRGRTFDRSDHATEYNGVIVSAALAERLWPGEDPLTKRIAFASDPEGSWNPIVGVVGNVRGHGLDQDPIEIVYSPILAPGNAGPRVTRSLSYMVRAENPMLLVPTIRAAIWELDDTLPVAAIRTMNTVVARSVAQLTFTMLALLTASVMALVLGMVGLYGVLSYVVSQRTRELGVRLALGATPAAVQKMVVIQGAKLAAAGVVLGVLGAVGLTRFMQSLLFETTALDPLAFCATSIVLFVVGLLASFIPGRRASNIDPMKSLRFE